MESKTNRLSVQISFHRAAIDNFQPRRSRGWNATAAGRVGFQWLSASVCGEIAVKNENPKKGIKESKHAVA